MDFKKYFKEEDLKKLKESKEKILALKKETKEKIFDLKWGLKDLLRSSPSQEEQLERLNALYKRKSYDKVITLFESDESLKPNEEIVDKYLWSLWMNDGTEEKANKLAHEYNKKFKTDRWDEILGVYAMQQKWFDVALSYFDKSKHPTKYNRVKKIFDDYDSLYQEKKYKEVIEYFENKLYLSHSKTKHEIVYSYLWSLYQNSGTERKALEKTKVFLEKYGDSDRLFNLAGNINKHLGEYNKNDNIIFLNNAIFFYQKTGNDGEIKKVNDIIKNYKNPVWHLKVLHERKSYDKVITLFESDESLKTNEEIVNKYLWSLWMNDGTEEKANKLAHEYNKKFKTDRWDEILGVYAEQQKWFDVALSYFDKSKHPTKYNRVKKIFDDYDSLYQEKKYKEVIEYFENKLYLSHSKTKHEIVYSYLWSLYQNSGTERKALEKTKVFLEKYGDSDRLFNLAGNINKHLGEYNKNDNIIFLNNAIFFYQKTGNDEEIKKVNDIIKQQAKEAVAREKQLAKEAVAREKQLAKEAAQEKKNKTHEYSVSNGVKFCRYCGVDDGRSYRDCLRENGHKYNVKRVLKNKYSGPSGGYEYKPICKGCGEDSDYNYRDCN